MTTHHHQTGKIRLDRVKFFHKSKITKDFWVKKDAFEFEEEPFVPGWKTSELRIKKLFRHRFRLFKKNFKYDIVDKTFERFAIPTDGQKQTGNQEDMKRFVLNQLNDAGLRYPTSDTEKMLGIFTKTYQAGLKNAKKAEAMSVDEFLAFNIKRSKVKKQDFFSGSDILISSILSAEAIDFVELRTFALFSELTLSQRSRLSDLIVNAIRDGEGIAGVKKNISNEFTGWSSYRAQMIARTETASMIERATHTSYEEDGIAEIKWLCGPAPCPLCDPNCGETSNLRGDDFAEWPIPVHPNCVCTTVPVVDLTQYQNLATQNGFEPGNVLDFI